MNRACIAVLSVLLVPLLALAEGAPGAAKLQVGTIVPLTGPLAEYGQAFQNGVALARKDFSAIARNCDFIVEDSKYDSKTAVAAFQRLLSSGQVQAVYNWGGPTSDALAPLAERKEVALFVWSADPKVAEGRQHVIRFSNSGADYGKTLADYLIRKGYRSVGIVQTENQYIAAIFDGLRSAAGASLSIETVDTYQPADSDFRATITKLKGRKYDALGIFMLSGQVSNFVKQLTAQQLQLPLFGTDFFESMTEVRESNGGMVGAVFANNEVSPDFRSQYLAAYHNHLQINHAANGYDFARFLCQVIKPTLSSQSFDEILRAAAAHASFSGKQGEALFVQSAQGDRYFRFPVVIRKITSNEIVTESKS